MWLQRKAKVNIFKERKLNIKYGMKHKNKMKYHSIRVITHCAYIHTYSPMIWVGLGLE